MTEATDLIAVFMGCAQRNGRRPKGSIPEYCTDLRTTVRHSYGTRSKTAAIIERPIGHEESLAGPVGTAVDRKVHPAEQFLPAWIRTNIIEHRIRFDEDIPVTTFLDCLEQQPEGRILVAKGRVNFRRTISQALEHLSRLIHLAHARVNSRDPDAAAALCIAHESPALFTEGESLGILTHLIVDIPQTTIYLRVPGLQLQGLVQT